MFVLLSCSFHLLALLSLLLSLLLLLLLLFLLLLLLLLLSRGEEFAAEPISIGFKDTYCFEEKYLIKNSIIIVITIVINWCCHTYQEP